MVLAFHRQNNALIFRGTRTETNTAGWLVTMTTRLRGDAGLSQEPVGAP